VIGHYYEKYSLISIVLLDVRTEISDHIPPIHRGSWHTWTCAWSK
jgi:hypothetical protein